MAQPPPRPAPGPDEPEEPILITPDMLAEPEKPDPRLDFEKGMSYFPRMTLALILTCTVIFGWEVSTGALKDRDSIIRAGALVRSRVQAGEYWRLLSAAFLHGGFDHLLGNCIVLFIVGMACEHALGLGQAMVVYFVSALCGAALSVVMSPGPSVGASGAIFGLVGSVIVFLHKHQRAFRLRDKRIGVVLLIWGIYTIISGFATPFVDNFAHVGGFVGGAVVTWFLKPALVARSAVPPAP